MKRLRRIIFWTAAGAVSLVLTIVAALVIFTRTARFNDLLRVQIVNYLAQTYRGQITIGSIEGSIWGSLTLRNIEVHHRGTTIASIPQLHAGYRILSALRGQIVVSDIVVLNPDLRLAPDPDGQWNLLAAIAERNPSPPSGPSSLAVALQRFTIERAAVAVTAAPSATYRLTDGKIEGAGHLGLLGQHFNVNTISFTLSGPKMPVLRASGAAQYNEAAQVATIKVPDFSIWTDHSRVDLNATLRDLSEKNVTAMVNLRRLAAYDVNSIAPQAGLARDVAGTIRLSGRASDLHTTIALNASSARITANVHADVTKSDPIWKLDSQLAGIDLHDLLNRKDLDELPTGPINAAVRAGGTGFSPGAVKSDIDAQVAGLSARGMHLGDLRLTAAVDRMAANLKALLAGPGGRAQLAGRVDASNPKLPAYNLTLTMDHLRPTYVFKARGIPSANLSLSAVIDGSGYQPDMMRLSTQVKLVTSSVGAIRIDSGRLNARLDSGLVRIATASLQTADTSVDINGNLSLDSRRSGQLNYKLTAGQISQWLGLVGKRGSGRIDLAGRAQGSLKALSTTGSVEVSALKVDSNSVAHARLTYDVGGLGTPLKPSGQVTLLANGLHAGIELNSLRTSIRLIPGANLGASVNISTQDRQSRPAIVRADIAYKPGLTVVNLSEMSVATVQGTWQLAAPAQITQRGSAIEIRRFTAAHHDQSVNLDGTLSMAGQQDLTLRVNQLQLADFAAFVPQPVKIIGLASTQLTIRGTAAAPVIAASGSVSQLQLAGIPQAGMSLHLSYANGRAQAGTTLSQDSTHSLTASIAMPFALSWAQGVQARPTGDVDLRAVSSGLDLGVFNAIRNPQISGVGGVLSLDVTAHGPLAHPLPHGFIRLSAVHASARQLKVEVTGGSADVQLGPGEVRLVSLSAKAGDGSLTGSGALTLKPNGSPDHLDARIALDRWPAIATHEYNATIQARIDAAGPLTGINVGGRVEVLYGVFRPDLSVTGSAPRPDETITVVHQWSRNPRQAPPPPPGAAANAAGNPNLSIDMDVVIDRNTWIKTPDFAVELEGHVHIHKKPDGEPNIYGTINTVRGTLIVASSQFDLTRGEIMFTGGHEINPQLLIVAQRRVQNYTVSATVGGSATKPTLTLSSVPDLPQADILSVMMFGKTTSDLSGGQQKDLQTQAATMAGGYAASQIGQAVAQSLGLSDLGVTTSSGGVGFGRYLTKNVYVSASQSASDMRDRRAEIQYYITPSVNLNTSASSNYGNEIKLQWHKDY